MTLDALLAQILWLFAAGFFIANLRVADEGTEIAAVLIHDEQPASPTSTRGEGNLPPVG